MSVTVTGSPAENVAGEAVLSEDGMYRYVLNYRWSLDLNLPVLTWIMLNPSTADAGKADPTITRCVKRALLWQWRGLPYRGICVLNLFALRATNPRELYAHPEEVAVGPENDGWLTGIASDAPVVAAWGAHGSLYRRSATVRKLLAVTGVELWCLGTCADGDPCHPLMLSYDTPLTRLL